MLCPTISSYDSDSDAYEIDNNVDEDDGMSYADGINSTG